MNTYEITKDEIKDLEVLAEGYKAINYDLSTKGDFNFRYGEKGEDLIGKIFKVDGDLKECRWGLHFSKDPAYVFNFYEPLGYNRYFKIRAYGNIVDSQEGFKTVAQIIEFVEEYDLMRFTEKIKRYGRADNGISGSYGINWGHGINESNGINWSDGINWSYGVNNSNGINESNGINWSNGINNSNGVNNSDGISTSNGVSYSYGINRSCGVSYSYGINRSCGVSYSYGVDRSYGINRSYGVSYSYGVDRSYGIRECTAVSESIFCNKIKCKEHYLFNKKTNEKRFNEVYGKILSFNYFPNFNNFYELKDNKEWWAVCFPELMTVDNKTAWSKMPLEMKEYIQSLPEYDEEIFKAITERE